MELQKDFVSELRSREIKFSYFLDALEQMDIANCRVDLAEGRLVFSSAEGIACSENLKLQSRISPKFDDGGIAQMIISNQSLDLGLSDFISQLMECGVVNFTIYPLGRKVVYFGLHGDCYYDFIRSAPNAVRRPEQGISRVLQ